MMKIGNRIFNTDDETYIMGILNVTPDSFYDGGCFNSVDNALRQTERMISEGADIIDVGGESTRPGHTQISDKDEIERVVPIIKSIKSHFDIPLSIDTYKSAVAREALEAGADMVNDIWGFRYDECIAKAVADYNACCCLMHNRKTNVYDDLFNDILNDLRESVALAKKYNIGDDKIIVDPGIGFAKTAKQNLLVTKNVNQLKYLGYPILYAASNKSFIGHALDVDTDNRLEGTLACNAWAAARGCSFIRVHQVMENKRVIQMIKAIMGGV